MVCVLPVVLAGLARQHTATAATAADGTVEVEAGSSRLPLADIHRQPGLHSPTGTALLDTGAMLEALRLPQGVLHGTVKRSKFEDRCSSTYDYVVEGGVGSAYGGDPLRILRAGGVVEKDDPYCIQDRPQGPCIAQLTQKKGGVWKLAYNDGGVLRPVLITIKEHGWLGSGVRAQKPMDIDVRPEEGAGLHSTWGVLTDASGTDSTYVRDFHQIGNFAGLRVVASKKNFQLVGADAAPDFRALHADAPFSVQFVKVDTWRMDKMQTAEFRLDAASAGLAASPLVAFATAVAVAETH